MAAKKKVTIKQVEPEAVEVEPVEQVEPEPVEAEPKMPKPINTSVIDRVDDMSDGQGKNMKITLKEGFKFPNGKTQCSVNHPDKIAPAVEDVVADE